MSGRKRNGPPSTAALQREVGRKSLLAAQQEDSAARAPKDKRRM